MYTVGPRAAHVAAGLSVVLLVQGFMGETPPTGGRGTCHGQAAW